jgi:hypothetical protein
VLGDDPLYWWEAQLRETLLDLCQSQGFGDGQVRCTVTDRC